ncbi:MAG: hypothetical protein SGI96_02465 [Bacteroidota bacterium]|nr:hypothetical protein [Bacteroidota bacterium]
MSKTFESEFFDNLGLLTKEQQYKALAYLKSLSKKIQNVQELLKFAGSIDLTSIRKISEAISTDCEKIDGNEW